jgi:transposase-like protein
MNTITIIKEFQSDEACVDFLCDLRWKTGVKCPYCGSDKISKHVEKNRRSRLQCSTCQKSFSPTVNTILHGSRVPLFKWFLAISLLAEAKKSISSRQLARHLDLPVKTAYSLAQRIRKALLGSKSPLLKGIIEMDETYIGGKPRYSNCGAKRGRGTDKMMIAGAMERNGNVIAKVQQRFGASQVRDMILENVDLQNAAIFTDDYRAYSKVGKLAPHSSVNHSVKEYVMGNTHINTIEGYWALLKRAWYGQHHHYSKKYAPLYIAEASFKYNSRNFNPSEVFPKMLGAMVCTNS